MSVAICEGAKGFLVGRLQRALGSLKVDNDFGPATARRVREYQLEHGMAETGDADPGAWHSLGLMFPTPFERCLMLTGAYEGTGFGGINRKDIDGAGVTLGIVGFTTQHGEVQRLITKYLTDRKGALAIVPSPQREKLLTFMQQGASAEAWERLFYGSDGIADAWVVNAIRTWGNDEVFQRIQMEMTEGSFWVPACKTARDLNITSMAGLGLLFDTYVQNGGWKDKHKRVYAEQSHDGTERARLMAMVKAIAAGANPKWQNDVYLRKVTFVSGGGKVHGSYYDLTDYGFEKVSDL